MSPARKAHAKRAARAPDLRPRRLPPELAAPLVNDPVLRTVSRAAFALIMLLAVLLDFAAALAPVGGVDAPFTVKPAASRLLTDLVPRPLTRVARSSASLKGPFLVRSSMIAFACTGPIPLTDSSAA